MDRKANYEAVQRMQDYIAAHINEPITLRQLAAAAGFSPWHANRLFKELIGKAPFEYIWLLRLSRAAITLRDGESRVIDVALDFVFDSHEGFTRAFSKAFGIAPKRYSRSTPPIPLFLPSRIYDYYLSQNRKEEIAMSATKIKTVFVQVMERPARKLMLKRGIKATDYYEYCAEVGCDVWGVLSSVKEALYEPVGLWLPRYLIREGTSQYVQGVELPMDYSNTVPEGFDLIDLPPCRIMVFQGEPYDDEYYEEAISEIWDVIKTYNPGTYGYCWDDEAAPRFQLAPMGYRGYIEARPVKEVNRA